MSDEDYDPPAEKMERRFPTRNFDDPTILPGDVGKAIVESAAIDTTKSSGPGAELIAKDGSRFTITSDAPAAEAPSIDYGFGSSTPYDGQANGHVEPDDWPRPADQSFQPDGASIPDNWAVKDSGLKDPIRIGLWGSPLSGKTTFLAALGLAAGRQNSSTGKWTVYPDNDASAELLSELMRQLVTNRKFPEATLLGSTQRLSWTFRGDIAGSVFAPRRRFWRRGRIDSSFRLDLVDVSGEAFGDKPQEKNVPGHVVDGALDHLASSQGLIYLFDPVSDRQRRNSAEYLNRTLVQLSRRMAGRLAGQYLPQQLSVCITKFDHPEIFQQARRRRLVDEGPDGVYRVLDGNAEQFFSMYCNGAFWDDDERADPGAEFVWNMLQAYFDPDRVRYFVSSSIGLRHSSYRGADHSEPHATVSPDDFANIREDENGGWEIRGPVRPINVLEPLISLQQRISGNRRAHG